jgi:MFS family permease
VTAPSRWTVAALALAGGLALADASVVALALPPIVSELHASVRQAAAVLGVYALALAVALPPAAALRRAIGPGRAGAAGLALMALASVGCALAGSVTALLVFRALQAAGAAAGLLAVSAIAPRRVWHAVSVFGTAAGPALGGALTQALDWRAVFWVQLPIAAAGALAAWRAPAPASEPAAAAGEAAPPSTGEAARPMPAANSHAAGAEPAAASAGGLWARGAEPAAAATAAAAEPVAPRADPRRLAALALVAAALVGVLFLLVLLLSTGWGLSPLAAAATVSVLPVAALAGARLPANPCAGALLLGAGVIALAAAPGAHPWWTIPPQIVAGIGMGLALPTLSESAPAATQLFARHMGIFVALAIIAPIASHQLDVAVKDTRERGAALILDARLPPLDKLSLVGTVTGPVNTEDPRGSLKRALEDAAPRFQKDPVERAAYANLQQRTDDALVEGVNSAFRIPLLVCGAFGLLAALLVVPPPGRARRTALATGLTALALAGVAHLARPSLAPEPVRLADPCHPRALPSTGGLGGVLQDAALKALDRAACRWGSSREELALALVDDQDAAAYKREHGVDPRSLLNILRAVLHL